MRGLMADRAIDQVGQGAGPALDADFGIEVRGGAAVETAIGGIEIGELPGAEEPGGQSLAISSLPWRR
jgi:hypothetical protein